MSGLKEQNPSLKVLVSLRPSDKNFSFEPNTNSTEQQRQKKNGIIQNGATFRNKFSKRMKEFLQRHNLDGVDLDWEFFREADKNNGKHKELLVNVIRTLRSTFRPTVSQVAPVPTSNLLITLTTSKFPRDLTDNYDFASLNK